VTCQGNCSVDCKDAAACSIECPPGARCTVDCGGAATVCADGRSQTCGSGVCR
jgi:hypothetical protein